MAGRHQVVADPVPSERGIAPADMYRISWAFLAHVQGLGLSTHGHRLLHATCRDLDTWSPHPSAQRGYRRPCISVRRILGTEATNGNRALTAGGLELPDSGLFDLIGMGHGRTWLCWRFTDSALALLFDDRDYGLFDASFLPALRTPVDFTVHSQVAMVRQMQRGTFTLGLESSLAVGRTWSTDSKSIMAALQRCAAQQHLGVVVLLDCDDERAPSPETAVLVAGLRSGEWYPVLVGRNPCVPIQGSSLTPMIRTIRSAGSSQE